MQVGANDGLKELSYCGEFEFQGEIMDKNQTDSITIVDTCESGQAMTEYITMVAILMGVALLLITLLDAFSDYGWRLLSLVGMDYP